MQRKALTAACLIGIAAMGVIGCTSDQRNTKVVVMEHPSQDSVNEMRRYREELEAERTRFRLAITRVLELDDQTPTGAVSPAEVVERMKAIDTSACPNDFRAAYLTHIHAWESLATAQQKRAEFDEYIESGRPIPEALVRMLLGDWAGKPNELIRMDKVLTALVENARTEVSTTFHRATEIAMTYGASAPSESN